MMTKMDKTPIPRIVMNKKANSSLRDSFFIFWSSRSSYVKDGFWLVE